MFCALPVYFEKSLFCKGEGFPQEVAVGKPVIMQGAEMLCQEEGVKCTSPLPVCAVQWTFHAEIYGNTGNFGRVTFALL